MRVLDHAVLRFVQRVYGIDIDRVRSHMAQVCADAPPGADSFIAEGVVFRIDPRARTIKTVTPISRGAPSNPSGRVTLAAVWPRGVGL